MGNAVLKKSDFNSPFRQRGAVLILMVFIIGLVVTAVMIKSFNAASSKMQQDEKMLLALGQAKEALLAWAVSHKHNPGLFPWPDRNGDGNYDGSSDCATNSFAYSLFIGRLPSKPDTSPCYDPNTGLNVYAGYSTYPGMGQEFIDFEGNQLWYAVSRNVVRNNQAALDPIINPSIINSPTEPWLRVVDTRGNLISDRVAVVIIAPGSPLEGQNRSGAAGISNFLDLITVGATTYSNRDYDDPDEDFVMGGDATLNNMFNDRLVFITIDELIYAVEKRVAAEARKELQTYQAALGRFPYAAPLGSTGGYSCVNGATSGLLPLDSNPGATCTCASASQCTCGFSQIESVNFARDFGSWATNSLNCSRSGNDCTCNGAGGCTALFGFSEFNCDATGNCVASGWLPSGKFSFTGTFAHSKVNSTTGACTNSCGSTTVECDAAGSFSSGVCGDSGMAPTITVNAVVGENELTSVAAFNANFQGMSVSGIGIPEDTVVSAVNNANSLNLSKDVTVGGALEVKFSRLPEWFEVNDWQDYIYYAVSRDLAPTMNVGGKAGVTAMLVTTGAAVISVPYVESKEDTQNRISCDVADYLDSNSNAFSDLNADGEEIFDATNKRRTLNYNDQLFIVAP
ncbi:MAG: hypothetical protein CVU35_02085 [Betaproteobacteria bacterium HGW-Betaproteobacteria-8]|nr:MAG: hypothetical protein CVU35_02085 [Betaproteobacteria bacterium HGW-Betaproteobacteria-8]